VAMLLAHWLSDHIMHDDKAYQEFLNQRGVV
jgi:hemerythrin